MKPREAIRCRQRSTLGKGNAHEEGQNGDVVGRPSWRSSFLGEISLWKLGTLQHMKESLNFVSACLKVVDTHRNASAITL